MRLRLQGRMRRRPRSALPAVRPLAAQPRCMAHGPHGLATCAVLRVFAPRAMPRGGVRNASQHSRIAAQTATTARKTILGSRPRRRARAWRPSRARVWTPTVRRTNTTPPGASGTRSAASSTGTRTGAARAARSRSRCAPVRPQRTAAGIHASLFGTRLYSVLRRNSGTQ